MVSLIGHFDLDPNRALDVFLDIFATHLATHYTFFLALLSFSPWAPTASFEPPPSSDGTRFDDVLANAEILSDGAPSDLNKPNDVLAQVLGFKFAHYNVSGPGRAFVGCTNHALSIRIRLTLRR